MGQRGHAAQPLQQVERGALRAQEGAQPPAHPEDAGARVRGTAFSEQRFQLALAVERPEDASGGRHSGDDQRFLRDDQGGAARIGRNAGLGGAIAGTHVLLQRQLDEPANRVAVPPQVQRHWHG